MVLATACEPAAGPLAYLGFFAGVASPSGRQAGETRNVSGFMEVSLRGGGTLEISQTGYETLRIEADERVLPTILSEVRGGRLQLGAADGATLPAGTSVRYVLTVRELRAVDTAGAASVEIMDLSAPELRVGMQGPGSARLSGRVERQEVRISGQAFYDASALESRDARVTTSGVARVVVNATETVIASISGAGNVEYMGDPALVSHTISGAGTVRRR